MTIKLVVPERFFFLRTNIHKGRIIFSLRHPNRKNEIYNTLIYKRLCFYSVTRVEVSSVLSVPLFINVVFCLKKLIRKGKTFFIPVLLFLPDQIPYCLERFVLLHGKSVLLICDNTFLIKYMNDI